MQIRNRLKQVFMNILDNALKYSKMNTKIFVKAEFSEFNGKNAIKVSIADQGCVFQKRICLMLWKNFYKANVSVRGSGIGLAVRTKL